MAKSKNNLMLESAHVAVPINSDNVIVLWHKEQLKLFQPVLTDEELKELKTSFDKINTNIQEVLDIVFGTDESQERKIKLTKIGVVVSYLTWNKIAFNHINEIVKFTKDNLLQVFILRY